jgi:hypothetical protein
VSNPVSAALARTDREQLYETTYHLAQMVYAAEHPEYPDLLSSALADAMRYLGQQ